MAVPSSPHADIMNGSTPQCARIWSFITQLRAIPPDNAKFDDPVIAIPRWIKTLHTFSNWVCAALAMAQ